MCIQLYFAPSTPPTLPLQRGGNTSHSVLIPLLCKEGIGEVDSVVRFSRYYSNPSSAISMLRIMARALLQVSSYSFVGSESATIPAPA